MIKPFNGLIAKTGTLRSRSTMNDSDPLTPARNIWEANGLPAEAISLLHLSVDADPAVDSSFRLGTAAQVSQTSRTMFETLPG